MKSTDLMIGDWVEDLSSVQIVSIDTNGYCAYKYDKATVGVKVENMKPIPLTRELLEKNGFEGDREVMRYHFEEDGQKYHFSLRQMYDKEDKPSGYSFFAFNVLTILDYVHELQHALKLCGIEKEIVL